jgi:hypothetical protein
MKWE